jgi:site-specific recombinase XerD
MSTEKMTIEALIDNHPDLVSQVEARAREGFFSKAALDAAVSAVKEGMIPVADHEMKVSAAVADATAKATSDATATERARIMAVHASCKGSNTERLFPSLVNDGCSERQANHRIQEALAVASDALDITSHHSGGSFAKKRLTTGSDIYAARAHQGGKQ